MNDSTFEAPPIVLVHGLCGLSRLLAKRRPAKEYFPGVRAYLESLGHEVLMPRISATAAITTRAVELKKSIQDRFGQRPVHVIGHSLGGLDARYLISHLGMDRQVLSLTTVGTPHRGTTFADWALSRFARLFQPLFRAAGIPDDAFFDLTTDACSRFNEVTPNAPDVRYYSVAGVCEKPWLGPEWWLSSRIVGRAEGPNDGIVSLHSATWGEATETWNADHLNLVNWPNRIMKRAGEWQDRAADYGNFVQRL